MELDQVIEVAPGVPVRKVLASLVGAEERPNPTMQAIASGLAGLPAAGDPVQRVPAKVPAEGTPAQRLRRVPRQGLRGFPGRGSRGLPGRGLPFPGLPRAAPAT